MADKTALVTIAVKLTERDRADGSMFVVSTSHPFVSAVADIGDWDSVLALARKTLEVNFGGVEDIRLTPGGGAVIVGVVG